MKTHPIPGDRVAWLQLRQSIGAFSASDAGCLYGVHPFRTLGDVAAAKLNPRPITEDVNTSSQARGQYLEPALLRWYEDQIGVRIVEPTVMYEANGILATPDGEFAGSNTDQPEAKTTRDYWSDGIPAWVRCQAVAQCAARPTLECVHVVWLDASMELQVEVVVPVPGEVEHLVDAAARFMAFIEMGMVPEGVELSYANVLALHPTVEPEATVDVTYDDLTDIRLWERARLDRVEAEHGEKAAKDSVARIMADAAVARFADVPVATWRNDARGARVLRATRHLFNPGLDEIERGERKVVV